MSNTAWITVGVVCLILTVPAGMVSWLLVPEGRYPVVLVALPALPVVWFGLVCLRKAGMDADKALRQVRKGLIYLLVGLVLFVVILAVVFMLLG